MAQVAATVGHRPTRQWPDELRASQSPLPASERTPVAARTVEPMNGPRGRRYPPSPLRVALLYLLVGMLWIVLSSGETFGLGDDAPGRSWAHLAMDWGFVAANAALAMLLVGGLHRRERAIARSHDQLHELTFYDSLSGLPNRRHLLERIADHRDRSPAWGALLIFDLDGFRRINDACGPAVADELLNRVASLLRRFVHDPAQLARVSADVFAVLVDDAGPGPESALITATALGTAIRAALPEAAPPAMAGLPLTACSGVTLLGHDDDDSAAVLARAEAALHRAQRLGSNHLDVFEHGMQRKAEARVALAARLRAALDAGMVKAYVQPQCSNRSRSIVGAEVLARWPQSDGSFISPAEFIPIAEEYDLIGPLGEYMLEAAGHLQVRLRTRGHDLPLAVNVSARQLVEPTFIPMLDALVERIGFDPARITLEVTESLLIDGFQRAAEVLGRLRERGFRISIDDFGTGYSSLAYLKRLPVDELKIDGSFVRDAAHDPRDRALVLAIVAVGRELGLAIVAEGIETEEQAALLDCGEGITLQGYLFGAAVPPRVLEQMLGKPAVAARTSIRARPVSVAERPIAPGPTGPAQVIRASASLGQTGK
jgi:diguanylate cyclase (GGDEF)-like protein